MYVLCRLSICKRCENVLALMFVFFALQAVTGDRQNRQYAGALDEMLSGEGVGPKKLVLVMDRIDVLGKHADGKKVMKLAPCIYFESILATLLC